MPPVKVIILQRNLMGDLIDDEGNRYNERHQRIDYLGCVIPEPWDEPATSSLGNSSAGDLQPQTLADLYCPDFFYRKRAALRAEKNRLSDEPPEQSYEFQSRGPSHGWSDAPLQVSEAPVQQESEILARVLKHREENAAYFKKLDEIFGVNTKITSQGVVVHEEVEEKVRFDDSGIESVDAEEPVDRRTAETQRSDEIFSKSKSWDSSEIESVDADLCVDRRKVFPSQPSSVSTSVDAVLCVDRREPDQPDSDVLESADTAESQPKPPEHVPEPSVPDPDLNPSDPEPPEPLPDPKPSEHHETKVVEVLPKEAATPGSCHRRKLPDTTLQPPLKRLRVYTGAIDVIPAAAYITDPGDSFAVYSRGPRPPPFVQRYLSSTPSSFYAGRCSYPPRSHPVPAYLPDPEVTDDVYHMGPRPP